MSSQKDAPRRRQRLDFPASLTDLHRLGKSIHGHDGSSRIVMVRKTDQRTFSCKSDDGKEPKLETVTRETIETFRGQKTACKFTTEKSNCEHQTSSSLRRLHQQHHHHIIVATNNGRNSSLSTSSTGNNTRKTRMASTDFIHECLTAHNEYRQKHGVPLLKLDREICKLSQQWADELVRRNAFEHSNRENYGENIYMMTTQGPVAATSFKGDQVVRYWYDEIKKYTAFGKEPENYSYTGHFTQVVWKTTTQLGVGIATSKGKTIVVANYAPPGNVIGTYASNVPPPDCGRNKTVTIPTPMQPTVFASNLTTTKRSISHTSIASSTVSGTKNCIEGDFEHDCLRTHNDFRIRHGVPPLKLDRKLCRHAEEWARFLATKNTLEHRKNSPYGENIYCVCSSDPNFAITGEAPVREWYAELRDHTFGREPSNLKTGHFTQVVWRTSELLGVGVAKSRQGCVYVVANYSPAGNFLGNFAENVPPPLSTVTTTGVDVKAETTVDNNDRFVYDALKVHNECRRKHGVPEMKLDEKLCVFAQEWADHCAKTGNMTHRPGHDYGENVFFAYSSDFSRRPSARDAVRAWYDEIKDYSFGGGEMINRGTLHFTQVVWRGSTALGVGIANNNRGESFVVANYSPRGNIIGQFVANVPGLLKN